MHLTSSLRPISALLAAVLSFIVTVNAQDTVRLQARQTCGKTSPRIGLQTSFVANPSSGHTISGTLTIIDDCTFEVAGFTQTPPGPQVFFWGANGPSRSDLVNGGRRISDFLVPSQATPSTLRVSLLNGQSFDSFNIISVWCEEFSADFGQANLAAGTIQSAPAAPPTSPSPPAVSTTPSSPANPATSQGCGKTSSRIGLKTSFVSNPSSGHSISGTVTIVDDCTFEVTGFTQTPSAPSVFFWGAPGSSVRSGRRISDFNVPTQSNPTNLTVKLLSGQSFDNFNVISVWCEEFSADFGQANLATPSAPPPAPIDALNGYSNCLTLSPGRLNLYWNPPFSNGSVSMALQASLDSSRGWFAFGVNDPSKTEISMLGADITLAGFDANSNPFVLPYGVTARKQCDYSETATQGTCPRARDLSAVQLLGGTKTTSNVYTVSFLRPSIGGALQAGSGFYPLDLNSTATRLIWALGPLSEDKSRPVVLFHKEDRSSSSQPFNLAAAGAPSSCSPIVPFSANGGGSSSGGISIISAETTNLTITLGPNPNYPNPPAWGVSYRINGLESPVLQVRRNVEYTFMIKSGIDHPFYITSSIVGGLSDPAEKIFAGNASTFGDEAKPYVMRWKPDASTPDTVYYQCTTHQKLGWKIAVLNASAAAGRGVLSVGSVLAVLAAQLLVQGF
ncbi:hypothetical protein HDU67_002554 [Dinochytrium kinnereticum]|nr:hypothetical protein HDU67_002554 [Dinochytrium kinnereticum]